MEVVKFMKEGVFGVVAHDHPPCYPLKLKAASTLEEELRDAAGALQDGSGKQEAADRGPRVRWTSRGDRLGGGEPEISRGSILFVVKSDGNLGPQPLRIVWRFVLEQGSKLRPIDDGLEAQLNSAYTSTIWLDLQDADDVVALTLELGKRKEFDWVGKTLDLSKAYKQLPILPSHRDLAVTSFRDSKGKARYYIPNALMFGATAAVYAFNRVSRSLWFLINVYLRVPTAVYFDVYPMFSPKVGAQEKDALVSDFLDLLWWRHNRTGPKGKPFAQSFDVLGVTLDLSGLRNDNSVTLKKRRESRQNLFNNTQGKRGRGHAHFRCTRDTWSLKFCSRILCR